MGNPLRMLPSLVVSAILCYLAIIPSAQAGDYFRPDGSYDPAIPTPADVLGFEIGERPARYEELVRYAEALAAATPRVTVSRYARSHENRDLIYMTITSKANQDHIAEIQSDITTLADPRISIYESELKRILHNTPVISYCAYSIHGDELSGADASLRVAYELAAGQTPDIEKLRQNLVVLIDPNENPDGRERILAQIGSFIGKVPNADPDALSHEGFWPWGRANHYLFDLNRDWFALVHPESRGRADILRQWRPQLVIDAHEMGSSNTYLFSPPRDPFNPCWPSSTLDWWQRFAADQANAFDQHGWSYYTRDWNEEFFPGYGSALAIYQGAVGILYEQSRTAGQPVRKPSGQIVTFPEAISHQYTSTMANLMTASENRQALLTAYRDSRNEAIDRGAKGVVKAFYFEPTPDPHRAGKLAERLAAMGIEVERLNETATLSGARSVWEEGKRNPTLPEGSYRVRLDQPDGLLAQVILSPHLMMPDSSLAQEREHLERKKGSRIYDVTAWSPLLASGLTVWWTPKMDDLDWEPTTTAPMPAGHIDAGSTAYGWLFDGTTDQALAFAAKLTSESFVVRVGRKSFEYDGVQYPRGSFLLRSEENPPDAGRRLRELVFGSGVKMVPVSTARILIGPDLGGGSWQRLIEPRIAILSGQPMSYSSVGAAWHLLDNELGIRTSLIDVSRVNQIDLKRYNTIVMPGAWGGGSGYRRALGERGTQKLKDWIRDGGTVVALAGGAEFLADSAGNFSQVRLRSQTLDDFPAPGFGLSAAAVTRLERMQATGLGADGKPIQTAGLYDWDNHPEALSIPGLGSPVLGPGLWEMTGPAGKAAKERGSLLAGAESSPDKTGDSENSKGSENEKKHLQKKSDNRLKRFLPSGAILRVDLDPEQWVAYGAGDKVAVMQRRSDAFLARDPVSTIGRFAAPGELHLGGLLWPEAVGRISQTAYLTRESMGRGQIILFASDPNFRGYFWGTQRLFLNALLLGPGLGTTHSVPW
jgi:Zinc carboxypeptidase